MMYIHPLVFIPKEEVILLYKVIGRWPVQLGWQSELVLVIEFKPPIY
jgi:hypothetical protein